MRQRAWIPAAAAVAGLVALVSGCFGSTAPAPQNPRRALRRPLPARATGCGCIVQVGPIGAVIGRLDGQAVYPPLAYWVPRAGHDIYALTGRR